MSAYFHSLQINLSVEAEEALKAENKEKSETKNETQYESDSSFLSSHSDTFVDFRKTIEERMAGLEARDAEARAGWPPSDEDDNLLSFYETLSIMEAAARKRKSKKLTKKKSKTKLKLTNNVTESQTGGDVKEFPDLNPDSNEQNESSVDEDSCDDAIEPEKLFELVKKHVPVRASKCKICDKKRVNMRRHIQVVHYCFKRYHCCKCGFRSFRRYLVRNHMYVKHGLKRPRKTMKMKITTDKTDGKLKEFGKKLGII